MRIMGVVIKVQTNDKHCSIDGNNCYSNFFLNCVLVLEALRSHIIIGLNIDYGLSFSKMQTPFQGDA